MIGTFVAHPLDTVKVRMQLESRNMKASQIMFETLRNEGVTGLYKGVS